jgi:hypothetical protein
MARDPDRPPKAANEVPQKEEPLDAERSGAETSTPSTEPLQEVPRSLAITESFRKAVESSMTLTKPLREAVERNMALTKSSREAVERNMALIREQIERNKVRQPGLREEAVADLLWIPNLPELMARTRKPQLDQATIREVVEETLRQSRNPDRPATAPAAKKCTRRSGSGKERLTRAILQRLYSDGQVPATGLTAG